MIPLLMILRAARQTCLSAEVKLRSEHNLRERKKFERKCARQTDLLKDKVIEIASLKAQLSLKEGEAAEAIRLREKSTLKGQVATLESTATSKDIELVSKDSMTDQDLEGDKVLHLALEERGNVSRLDPHLNQD
ncbi:hypothetical protein Tco_1092358 [Tanacetum coccineum]|uniref:Uncharacterized protein n=1 Tax=Tanacetum coccineum TaxID=301880 RepID=A0ABQ5IB01_9ASTR